MKILGLEIGRAEKRAISYDDLAWARLIHGWDANASVTCGPDQALTAMPVFAAVNFIAKSMATLDAVVERQTKDGWERVRGGLGSLIGGAVNDEWSSYRWREYTFRQTLTVGRSFTWIERPNGQIINLWPLDPHKVVVRRIVLQSGGYQTVYIYTDNGFERQFAAADIIDLPFALAADQITHISPLDKGRNAIGLMLAMEKYAAGFFAGGGVPPLALEGPLPASDEAMKRMMADVNRAIDGAKNEKKPIFPMPAGYTLKPVGFDPEKGQMTDARRFQVEEVARLYDLPPWFLQDLTNANFANSENQDLHLVKHTLAQWAEAWAAECNLKLFSRRRNDKRVRIDMDSILRGDFKTRADATAALVHAAVYTPNDARRYMGLDPDQNQAANRLYIQGADVPLEKSGAQTQPTIKEPANGA